MQLGRVSVKVEKSHSPKDTIIWTSLALCLKTGGQLDPTAERTNQQPII